MGDLKQRDDLRVVDDDGHRVFCSVPWSELGQPIFYEAPAVRKAA